MTDDTPVETRRIVIVGGGLAAATAATTLRDLGHRGPITLFAAEEHLPYERPGLSKGFLAGDTGAGDLEVVGRDWYDEHEVSLRLGQRVTGIDRATRTVATADNDPEPYDRLLLATGASPRRLPMADALSSASGVGPAAPVCYLRTIDDAARLREHLAPGRRVVIIGGGFLGLEVAATARGRGADVTLVETQRLPLAGVLGEQVALQFAEVHREHGVDLRLGVRVTGVRTVDGQVLVELAGRPAVAGDVLVVGIGATPDTDLAVAAGLDVDDGIVVDEQLRSSDPAILAAGDVASAWHPVLERRLRVEHWANAKEQGAVAARVMLGHDAAHTAVPYFFTDQYDLGLEYFGHAPPEETDEVVVHGELSRSRFVALYLQQHRIRAALHVNEWDRSEELRSAVTASASAPQSADQPLAKLHRWVEAGGEWRLLSASGPEVTVGLFTCTGGEQVDSLTTADPQVLAYVGAAAR